MGRVKWVKGKHNIFFVYEGAHIYNLYRLVLNNMVDEEANKLQNCSIFLVVVTKYSKEATSSGLLLNYYCDVLRDLVPFLQFKKHEKHPWVFLTKNNTPPWVVFTFFKLYKWYQTAQRITVCKQFLVIIIHLLIYQS